MKTHKSLILRRLPGAQVIGVLREKRRAKKGEGGLVPEPSSALLGAFPRRTSPLFSCTPFNFHAALQLNKRLEEVKLLSRLLTTNCNVVLRFSYFPHGLIH